MSEQIIQVLEYLSEKLGVAIDWTSANVIPQLETLMRHIITYNIANSTFGLIIGIVLLVLGIYFTFKKFPISYAKYDDSFDEVDCFKMIAYGFIGIAFIIAGTAFIITTGHHLIEAICFPEMSVLRYIQSFMTEYNG